MTGNDNEEALCYLIRFMKTGGYAKALLSFKRFLFVRSG